MRSTIICPFCGWKVEKYGNAKLVSVISHDLKAYNIPCFRCNKILKYTFRNCSAERTLITPRIKMPKITQKDILEVFSY